MTLKHLMEAFGATVQGYQSARRSLPLQSIKIVRGREVQKGGGAFSGSLRLVSPARLLSSHWRRWSVSGCERRAEERGRERGKRRWKSAQGWVEQGNRTPARFTFFVAWASLRSALEPKRGHFEIWWGLFLVGNSTMIWYVATLIASVFSTRGTAAQGESKCSEFPL